MKDESVAARLDAVGFLETLQAQLNRAQTLAGEIQRQALGSQVLDAEAPLTVIDAMADALVVCLGDLVGEAEAASRALLRDRLGDP